MEAEGARMQGRAYEPAHLKSPFVDGFDLHGGGRGPLAGDYPGYRRGDLPIAEDVRSRVVSLPSLIDPSPGYLDQYVAALEKVTSQASSLMS
jgi:hypothetical protein